MDIQKALEEQIKLLQSEQEKAPIQSTRIEIAEQIRKIAETINRTKN